MSAQKKPRKRLEKLVSGMKEKIKRAQPPSEVAAESVTRAALAPTATVVETIRRRAVMAGYVIDELTKNLPRKQPVVGALVEIVNENLKSQTDSDGFYYFMDRPEERNVPYELKVSAPHLGSRYGTKTVQNVDVKKDSTGRQIFDAKAAEISLPPTAVVGQVKNSAQQPLANAMVQVLNSEAKTLTDKSGVYALFPLLAGRSSDLLTAQVTVQASCNGYTTASPKRVTLNAGQKTTADFQLDK